MTNPKKLHALPLVLPLLLASASPVLAHHAEFMSDKPFLQGLSMPAHGLDHLLSAFAIGLVASQAAPPQRHRLPVLFAVVALLGSLLNLGGIALPELSVPLTAAAGAALLLRNASPAWPLLAVFAGIAGVCNGQALFTKPLAHWDGLVFASGCLLSALVLTYAGMLAGSLLNSAPARRAAALLLLIAAVTVAAQPELNSALIRVLESGR